MKRRHLAGHLWASPLTALGVLQALLGGARFHSIGREGTLQFVAGEAGAIRWFVRSTRVAAYTWGAAVTYASSAGLQDTVLGAHEQVHVHQAMRWGLLLPFAYGASSFWQWIRGGRPYFDNTFERQARQGESAPDR